METDFATAVFRFAIRCGKLRPSRHRPRQNAPAPPVGGSRTGL